jgi:hypothetical protein
MSLAQPPAARSARAFLTPRDVAGAAVLLAGLGLAWMDSRPRWDDAGITVLGVLIASAAGTAARVPAWLAPVLVAGPIVLAEIGWGTGVLLALPFAAVGALVGWAIQRNC